MTSRFPDEVEPNDRWGTPLLEVAAQGITHLIGEVGETVCPLRNTHSRPSRRLLGVRDDVEEIIRLSHDLKVQPPARRDPDLPDIPRLVVLLRSERRMPEIAEKAGHAAVYGVLD